MSKHKVDGTLPLSDTGTTAKASASPSARPKRSLLKMLPLALLLLFSGGVFGMYFQPPLLRAFYAVTGLQPGGGTETPIAQAIEIVITHEEIAVVSEGDVVALGRLIPKGDVITVATPFGAGDARISAIEVAVGDQVVAGQTLAVLDNLGQLESTLNTVRAALDVRVATLAQVEQSVAASLQEAQASLERIESTAETIQTDLARATTLLERDAITRVEFDTTQARAIEVALDVERARVTLSRFDTQDGLPQPDIAVAEANLNVARADLDRAQQDLSKAYIRAPADGTVLDIHVRSGEKPGAMGVLDLGDTENMTVEAEIYQTLIGRVSIGDTVKVFADALGQELTGSITAIGIQIGRQTITSDDPAANTDARVVDVIVALDDASSALAARFTNLEVVVRIDTDPSE